MKTKTTTKKAETTTTEKKKKIGRKPGRPEPIRRTLEFAGCWCEDDGRLTFRFFRLSANFHREETEEITFEVSESGWEEIEEACNLTAAMYYEEEEADQQG